MTRQQILNSMEAIVGLCEIQQRGFSDAESSEFNRLKQEAESLLEEKKMPTRTVEAPSIRTSKNKASESYNLSKMMTAVANQRAVDGLEREYDEEVKSQQPWREFGGLAVPLENIMLSAGKRRELAMPSVMRASGVVSPTNLSPLTGVDHRDELMLRIDDAIGKELLAGKLGGKTVTGLTEQTVRIPRQTGMLSTGYVQLDTDLPASSDPTFSNYDMTPHLVGGVTQLNMSHFMAVHPDANEDFFAAELRRALTQSIDDAILQGDSGVTAAQPDGLLTVATDSTENVAHDSTAQDSLIAIKKILSDYLGQVTPSAVWVMDSDVIDGFRTVSAFSGQAGASSLLAEASVMSNVLLEMGLVRTTRFETNDATTPDSVPGMLLDGQTLVNAFWGGVDVAVNPYADSVFSAGGVLIRAMAMHDVGVVDPKRVIKFTCDLQTGGA